MASMMELRSLTLALYRAQLRAARRLDARPGLLSVLPQACGLAVPDGAPPVAREVAAAAAMLKAEFFAGRGGIWCMPPQPDGGGAGWSVEAAVRDGYRRSAAAAAAAASGQGQGQGQVGALVEEDPTVVLDAALNLHRQVLAVETVVSQEAAAVSETAVDVEAASSAAALDGSGPAAQAGLLGAARWALEEAPAIAPGCLLLEHPSGMRPGRTVLLVYDISKNVQEVHGNEDWTLRALVINRPLPTTVGEATGAPAEAEDGPSGVAPAAGGIGALGKLPCFHGGQDGGGALFVAHRRGEIPGAVAIDPLNEGAGAGSGLFLGGDGAAISAAIKSGAARAGDFRVLLGCTEIKLEGNEDEGTLALPDAARWVCVRGPGVSAATLAPPLFATSGPWAGGKGLKPGESVQGYNYGRFWHQNAMWSHLWRSYAAGAAAAASSSPSSSPDHGAALSSLADVHTSVHHICAASGPLQLQLAATATVAYAQAQEMEGQADGS